MSPADAQVSVRPHPEAPTGDSTITLGGAQWLRDERARKASAEASRAQQTETKVIRLSASDVKAINAEKYDYEHPFSSCVYALVQVEWRLNARSWHWQYA